MDSTVTLGAWLAAHPGDIVDTTLPPGAEQEKLCRSALGTVTVAGRPMARSALFVLPDAPPADVLADTAKLAERVCRLSEVWLVASEPDSLRALVFADSVGRTLDSLFGAADARVAFRAPSRDHERGWTTAAGIVGISVVQLTAARGSGVAAASRPAPFFISVAAGTAHSSLVEATPNVAYDSTPSIEAKIELANADSAVAWTSPEIAAALQRLFARIHLPPPVLPLTATNDSDLVRAARLVRTAGPQLDPARRSAALFALDAALSRTAGSFRMDDSGRVKDPLLARLRAEGIGYTDASLDELAGYDGDLLHQAFAADSLGRAGRVALIALLRNGWYAGPGCGAGPAAFDSVIVHGESALRRGERDPFVHYYVGSAYNDVVWLAHHGDDIYVDEREFTPREAASRVRAIEHFRAALPGIADDAVRREIVRSIVALELGRWTGARYFCIYD